MLPTFSWKLDRKITNNLNQVLLCLTLTSLALSGCANITVKPKDPELMRLSDFAEQATLHLYEMNPLTYEQFQGQLENDLAPNLFAQLKARGSYPSSKAQIKKTVQSMAKTNDRCLIRIQSTTFPSKATPEGLIPIEVQGIAIKTRKDDSKGSHFDVIYLVGTSIKTKQPVIASIQVKKFD